MVPRLRGPPFLTLDLDDFLPPHDACSKAVDEECAYAFDEETKDEYPRSCVRHLMKRMRKRSRVPDASFRMGPCMSSLKDIANDVLLHQELQTPYVCGSFVVTTRRGSLSPRSNEPCKSEVRQRVVSIRNHLIPEWGLSRVILGGNKVRTDSWVSQY